MSTLFSLIKKLTKSEKRRFKLYSSKKSGQNKYLILFEFMEGLSSEEEYSEEKLTNLLKDEGFFKNNKSRQDNTGYLRAMQFYVGQQILKTLRTLNEAEKKPRSLINIRLMNAELVSRKGLNKLREKEIKKAIALAKKFDLTEDLFRIKRFQIGIAHYSFNKKTTKQVNKLHDESSDLLLQMQVETKYSKLYYKLYHLYLEGLRYSKKTKEIKQLEKEVMALNIEIANQNFHTHYVYYNIKAFFFLITNKLDKAFGNFMNALDVWNSNPIFIIKYPMRYQALLANYLNLCILRNHYDENYSNLLTKMKKLKIDYRKDYIYNQAMIVQIEQLRILNTGNFDEAVDFIKEVDVFLAEYKTEVTAAKWFNFQYNIMTLYFMLEDYENALTHAKALLEFDNKKIRHDLKAKTIIFYLIFLYECNNEKEAIGQLSDEEDDKYWNAINSVRGKLEKPKQHNAFHKLVEGHLFYIMNTYDTQRLKIEFHKMRSKLSELKEKIGNDNIGGLGIEEVLLWIESKITRKSIQAIIKEERNSEK